MSSVPPFGIGYSLARKREAFAVIGSMVSDAVARIFYRRDIDGGGVDDSASDNDWPTESLGCYKEEMMPRRKRLMAQSSGAANSVLSPSWLRA